MVIRNKDGSIYSLKKPNPLLKDQHQWAEFKLHNLKFTPETKENKTPSVTPIQTDFNIKPGVLERIEEIKEEDLEEASIPIIESTIEAEKEEDQEKNSNKTKIYCLPFIIKRNIDKLYGEDRPTAGYGKKFIFEGIIIEDLDFRMLFWTNIDFIESGSIIYPVNESKRWWKVHKKESKHEGWLYTNVPYDIHPDFT